MKCFIAGMLFVVVLQGVAIASALAGKEAE